MKIMNYWDKVAPFYNLTRRGEREAYERMYELVRKRIVGKEVLELATSTGLIALNTADVARRYVATDYSEKMLAQIKDPGIDVLRFEQADATALQYADGEFDVVIIANALHIMPQPDKALLEIARVLRADGILIAPTYVHGDNTFGQRLKASLMRLTGFREYAHWTSDSYLNYLVQRGWHIIQSEVIPASFPLAYVECTSSYQYHQKP